MIIAKTRHAADGSLLEPTALELRMSSTLTWNTTPTTDADAWHRLRLAATSRQAMGRLVQQSFVPLQAVPGFGLLRSEETLVAGVDGRTWIVLDIIYVVQG